MQFQFLFILCILFCVNSVKPHQCEKAEGIEYLDYPERRKWEVIKIICTNVTQETVFNYTYVNEKYPQHLYIESYPNTNNLPILHSNSSISKFAGIKLLVLRSIGLEVISPGVFGSFETLEQLFIYGNQIHKISNGTFDGLKNLKIMDLSKNSIEVIEEGGFSNLHNLEVLYLSNNKLTKIYSGTFDDLKNLKKLDLAYNSIETIEEDSFSGLFHLERLHLGFNRGYNKISALHENLFRDLTSLTNLDMSGNHITELPNNLFINLTNLKGLYIISNDLTAVDFVNFPKVERLALSGNDINSVRNWKNLDAETVDMSSNEITEFEIPENVVILDFHGNNIRNIINTFSNESKPIIRELYLNYNEISDIDSNTFKKLVNLNKLFLSHNKITIIRENTFKDCISLNRLGLSSNEIESIEPNAFKGISPEASIDISRNYLKVLRSNIFPDQIIKIKLDLDEEVDITDLRTLVRSSKLETSFK